MTGCFVRTSTALVLTAFAFALSSGEGVAEARVWSGHNTQFSSPTSKRSTAAPVRSHAFVGVHGGMVAPHTLVSSPVRPHAGMAGHYIFTGTHEGPGRTFAGAGHENFGRAPGMKAGAAALVARTHGTAVHGLSTPHLGALGSIKNHSSFRPTQQTAQVPHRDALIERVRGTHGLRGGQKIFINPGAQQRAFSTR